jgi:D-alanyl-D-alanine carboxypeptidase
MLSLAFVSVTKAVNNPNFTICKEEYNPVETSIEAELQKIIERRGIPGISLTVNKKKKTNNYTAGYADVEDKVEMNQSHRMLLGSVGKSFFAALTLQLAEDGKIGLDDKASKYLGNENWFNKIANHESITIRSLLNHTSGVPEYVYSQTLWQTLKSEPEKKWTAADRMQFIADAPAPFEVGKGWAYADANYIVLGAALEKATKKDVYNLVDNYFFKPFGLSDTEPSVNQNIENLAAGYTGNFFANLFGEKVADLGRYNLNPQFEWTGGGFVTNPEDLATWITKLYNGKVLSKKSTMEMFSPVSRQSGKADSSGYGLGAEIFETRYGRAYGHTGFMPGFQTFMAYFPDYDTSIAFQINIDPYSGRLKASASAFELIDEILPLVFEKNKAAKKTTTLYFVRHAEKADDGTRNPGLTEEGMARAEKLAKLMGSKNIHAVYSSPYKRTILTGEPLAKQIEKELMTYNPMDATSIFEIIAKNEGKSLLIVGHSNTVPAMLNLLGRNQEYEIIPEEEYASLFKVEYNADATKITETKY